MRKDPTIVNFINELRLQTNFEELEFPDFWDGDLCAIGLIRGDKLVYICTYAHLDGEIIKYDYDFESFNPLDPTNYIVLKEVEAATEIETINDIKLFLGI